MEGVGFCYAAQKYTKKTTEFYDLYWICVILPLGMTINIIEKKMSPDFWAVYCND